ncbi:MAG: SAF domain-containing protein, partial [Ignavibacteria bacterium]
RKVEKAIGKVNYELSDKMKKSREFSRSLFAVKDITAGEIFSEKNVKSIRPGYGLHPKYFNEIIGKKAKSDITFGTPLSWDLIE